MKSGTILKPSTRLKNGIKINSEIEDRLSIKRRFKKIIYGKIRLNTAESWYIIQTKTPIEKMQFQMQKYENSKSKNDIKKPRGPFNKEV